MKEPSLPKISIVIATFNAEATLETCLKSIEAQRYPQIEVLVADGGSKDRTCQILQAHTSLIAHQISSPDRGIYDAWNKVIPKATGDWLLFLGADDSLWDSQSLALAASQLAAIPPGVRVVYGKVAIALPDGEILTYEGEPWSKSAWKFRHEMTIPHQGTFHRGSLFQDRGLFNPDFKICGDYEFLLRELKDHPASFLPDLVVSRMGFGGTSSTLKNVSLIIDELDRARKLNGLTTPSPYIVARRLRAKARAKLERLLGHTVSDSIADLYRVIIGKPRLWSRVKTRRNR